MVVPPLYENGGVLTLVLPNEVALRLCSDVSETPTDLNRVVPIFTSGRGFRKSRYAINVYGGKTSLTLSILVGLGQQIYISNREEHRI